LFALGVVNELADQIVRRIQAGAAHIAVFLKLVPGGRYAEDIEVRLRARYAVLSGLSVADYVPEDEEHLGYFQMPWPRGSAFVHAAAPPPNDLSGRKLIVPFEWFRPNQLRPPQNPNDPSPQAVLLLWLPAE